ncbi:TIGR00282 family metallophosphoesterase [Candidatus Poribacteria bacterium]|nr:MAG: TIGR00282 family metallophosphoesterase [Candidatus Poribacteria bacterium]
MRILFIGDIVGNPGRRATTEYLKELNKSPTKYDYIVANGENAAGGKGITFEIVDQLLASGVSAITTGNHVWDNKDIFDFIDTTPQLIRPANYPTEILGKGVTIVPSVDGSTKLAVINLAGQIFMNRYANPFHALNSILAEIKMETPYVILDFHAEATSEKIAMGWHADGKIGAVVGTHTHVQTADERVLPKGTAYITDVGMTGPHDSVIGSIKEQVVESFLTMMPKRFVVAKDNIILNAVDIELNDNTGLAESIQRIQYKL